MTPETETTRPAPELPDVLADTAHAADVFGNAAAIASDYHDGMADPMYALGSTGSLVVYWGGPTVDRQLARAAELCADLLDDGTDLATTADELDVLRQAADLADVLVDHVAELAEQYLRAAGLDPWRDGPDDDRGTAVDERGRTTHSGWDRLAYAIRDGLGDGWVVSVCDPGVFSKGRRVSVRPTW